jgi:hypothetical protein
MEGFPKSKRQEGKTLLRAALAAAMALNVQATDTEKKEIPNPVGFRTAAELTKNVHRKAAETLDPLTKPEKSDT